MPDLDLRCTCVREDGRFSRQCDYCGTEWTAGHCSHDDYQDPCPHCDVVPVVQFIS
jgi:hypothetical protein